MSAEKTWGRFFCLDSTYFIPVAPRQKNRPRVFQRSQGAVAVGGEIGAVGGIDADHGDHLQKGKKKAPRDATLKIRIVKC